MKIEEKKWNTFSQTFIAEEEYEFLIIGNFNDDASTNFESPEHTDLKYAYYYIDDVLVKKVPPFIDVPEAPNPFEDVLLKKGEIIQLENIYFDIDRADFLPRSFPELEKLIDLLKSKPTMVIEIHGHTDNIGDAEYNAKLSLSRAQAVADYLSTHQISYTRTSYKGFGSTKPIASNETAEGRRANRRVEFLIIKE